MISVCLASYNGEKFIAEQIQSILSQLTNSDELVISDDSSTDSTIDIIKSFSDPRIKLLIHNKRPKNILHKYEYTTANFSNAINNCSGDYIFLSDQDDIWLPNKISTFKYYFNFSDIIMSNCSYIDEYNNIILDSRFDNISLNTRFFSNILFNKYQGSCMAFKRVVLSMVSPIPQSVPHDMWIGVLGSLYFKTSLCYSSTLLYRRHSNTVTSQLNEKSNSTLFVKIYFRILFFFIVFARVISKFRNKKF
jgi:glycosyltransferase involved in cell wall biosynthesis